MPITEDFVIFLDTETTGVRPGHDEVCEIAAIVCDLELAEISRFEKKIRLMDPTKMTKEAAQINGYDPAIWAKEAVPFFEFQAWLAKHVPYGHVAVPIGHNVGFDRSVIDEKYYKPYGKFCPLSYHMIDTAGLSLVLKLAGVIDVPNVKLGTVCEALKLPAQPAHRAMGDCESSRQIFEFVTAVLRS